MTTKTSAQRKAAERARRREQGLKPLEIWAKPEHHQQIKQYAKLLEVSEIKAVDTIKTC